MINLKLKRIF